PPAPQRARRAPGPPRPPVGEIAGYPHVDSPQEIDDLLKPGHLHQRITVDPYTEVVANRVEEKLRPAPRRAERFPIDPGRIDAADGVAGKVDVQVARDGDQRY